MKKLAKIILLGITFVASVGYIKIAKTKDTKCLEIIGVALDEKNELIDGVQVTLFKKNEELEWVEVTSASHHDHNFKFVLDANEYYTIEVYKPGFVKRLVVVSTQLPENVSIKPIFSFGFEVTLFKEKKGVDDYYLDFPVALVGYSKSSGVFENSYNYTHHIKNKIKESEQALKSN